MNWSHSFAIIYLFCVKVAFSENIPIRIVDEPLNYEHGNFLDNTDTSSATEDVNWMSTVHPANFTGPEHLRQLIGHCFFWNNLKYKYIFCPFHNVTQHEISSTWNPYKGVLGVWGEWSIRENKFSEMMYLQGDSCEGGGNRSVKVQFECKEDTFGNIQDVSEPDKCIYHLKFATQLVCHPHALLVYPSLNRHHQHMWNRLYSEHTKGEITDKGMEIGLQRLFQSAGLHLSQTSRSKLRSSPKSKYSAPVFLGSPCEMQLERLRTELQALQEELKKISV